MSGIDSESLRTKFGLGLTGAEGDVLQRIEKDQGPPGPHLGQASRDEPLLGDLLGGTTQEKAALSEQSPAEGSQPAAKTEEMEEEEL